MVDGFDDAVDFVVVRCFACSNWVRRTATKIVKTGEREDEERWCLGCIQDVEDFTNSLGRPEFSEIEPFDPGV